MFDTFTITAASRADHEQAAWLFRNRKFFPEFDSIPPLPTYGDPAFDYRELVKLQAVGDRQIIVRTRQQYTEEQFAVNVIPAAQWTARYGLTAAPSIVGSIGDPFANPLPVFEQAVFVVNYVSPLIKSWYDSLTVKPSNLLDALNKLADGMSKDGNWSRLDFFAVIAGMETDEQRMRPLITTTGNDMVPVGSNMQYDFNGAINTLPLDLNASATDLMWNPTNGVKYQLNDAFIGAYSYGTNTISGDMGAVLLLNDTTVSMSAIYQTTNGGGSITLDGIYINVSFDSPQTAPFTGRTASYVAISRTSSTAVSAFMNGVTKNGTRATVPMVDMNLYGGALHMSATYTDPQQNDDFADNASGKYFRAFLAGAGSGTDQQKIMNRLDAFFATRGLSITN